MSVIEPESVEFRESILRLSRDLRRAAAVMSEQEARYLVDAYYIHQEDRKRLFNQIKAMANEPHQIIAWEATQAATMESQIKAALDIYSEEKLIGRWMKANVGIGPIIAAGLLAHIDIRKAPTVGHMWRFGGYDPTVEWLPKTKRPWNASLKVVYFHIGHCFLFFSNKKECVYGHEYKKRKEYEIARNNRGDNRELAAEILTKKKFNPKTDAYRHYSSGKLPPAQIDARARRYAVKLFLSHLQLVWWFVDTGQLPPKPYALGPLGHADFIRPQHLDMIPGLENALRKAGL